MFVPLEKPGGWYVGATYKTDALSRCRSEASLGLQGMVALINTRIGRLEIIAGPAAALPDYDIAGSAMFEALKTKPNGAWVGPSAPDRVERINGFHQVPGRDLAVVVAVDRHEALEQAETWVGWARGLAWAGTLVVLMAAALLLYGAWTYRTTKRLRQTIDRERALSLATRKRSCPRRAPGWRSGVARCRRCSPGWTRARWCSMPNCELPNGTHGSRRCSRRRRTCKPGSRWTNCCGSRRRKGRSVHWTTLRQRSVGAWRNCAPLSAIGSFMPVEADDH